MLAKNGMDLCYPSELRSLYLPAIEDRIVDVLEALIASPIWTAMSPNLKVPEQTERNLVRRSDFLAHFPIDQTT